MTNAWLDELAKWARPGMHVKRWLLLLLLALTFAALGIAFLLVELYRTQPFPEFVWYLTLQWLPRAVRGLLFLIVSAALVGVAIYQLSKSLLKAVQPPYSSGRLVDLVYNYRLPQRRPTVVAFVGSRGFAALQAHRHLYAGRLVALASAAEGALSPSISGAPSTGQSATGAWAESVIVPAAEPFELCAELEHGTLVLGAAAVRARRSGVPIKRVFLVRPGEEPASVLRSGFVQRVSARVLPEVLDLIREADTLVFGPGSFYLHVIPNLLLSDVSDAVQASRARKVLICNLMTEPGQTDDFTVGDFVRAIHAYGGFHLDYALVNVGQADRSLQAQYAAALASPVIAESDSPDASVQSGGRRLQKLAMAEGVVLVGADLVTTTVERRPPSPGRVGPDGESRLWVLRHDPHKLAVALAQLLGVN